MESIGKAVTTRRFVIVDLSAPVHDWYRELITFATGLTGEKELQNTLELQPFALPPSYTKWFRRNVIYQQDENDSHEPGIPAISPTIGTDNRGLFYHKKKITSDNSIAYASISIEIVGEIPGEVAIFFNHAVKEFISSSKTELKLIEIRCLEVVNTTTVINVYN